MEIHLNLCHVPSSCTGLIASTPAINNEIEKSKTKFGRTRSPYSRRIESGHLAIQPLKLLPFLIVQQLVSIIACWTRHPVISM